MLNDINNLRQKRAAYQMRWRTERQSAESKLKDAWIFQRARASRRGIEFLLTFEEWLKVWKDSGHIHERGKFKHQYCMARHGDCGAYAVGNVSIITMEENKRQQRNPWIGRKATDEHKAKLSAGMLGNNKGVRRQSIELVVQ